MEEYITQNKARFLEELIDFLKIPSISTHSKYKKNVTKASEWLKEALLKAGCEDVEIFPTERHPIVYGERIQNTKLPTVLVYGHYDVQPADPLNLWETAPFEPVIKKTQNHPQGAIFGRGASDDKGQVYMHIKALEMMIANNNIPCNIKFLIEGEEETGSTSIPLFLKKYKKKLKSDIILISDTTILNNNQPTITTGLRGMAYMEVEVTGPNRDLHSGFYGGAVANPLNILSKMIAALHDKNNQITIPKFYEKVTKISQKEQKEMNKIPFDIKEYRKKLAIENEYGEKGYSTLERTSIRPALDVNGIWGGYIQEGSKTVIPSKAFAKISIRLVPNQDWNEISNLFEKYFQSIAPKGTKVACKKHHGGSPYVLSAEHNGYKAAYKAYQKTFKKQPLPQRSGGSIPIVSLFEKELGIKSVLMGFGLDTDAIHSPNEHFGVFNFLKGIATIPYFYHYFRQYHTP